MSNEQIVERMNDEVNGPHPARNVLSQLQSIDYQTQAPFVVFYLHLGNSHIFICFLHQGRQMEDNPNLAKE